MKLVVSALVVAGIAVPAAAHSAKEQRAEIRARAEMDSFANAVAPIVIDSDVAGTRSVTLNGAQLYFRKHTEQGSLDEVLARVEVECASGSETSAFGLDGAIDDGREAKRIALERVVTQEAESGAVKASLCIFANEDGAHPDEMRRVRYTLAHRRDDGSIAVTTVVHASRTPLAELFPAEGDAPGSDFTEIARPDDARRSATIIVGKNEHSVRVYESALDLNASVASYDHRMAAMGFATTGATEDARMYRKDGQSWVASFRATTAGSTIALMPFTEKAPFHRGVGTIASQ